MTDRDLIAEGREVLTACAILRADAELARWAKNNLPALLDALEAAQRPPLGYVVLKKRPLLVSGYRYAPVGEVEHDAEFLAYRKTHHPLSDGEYVFAEVREVQP